MYLLLGEEKESEKKEPPSSKSDFERETSVATFGDTFRRSVKGMKV